MPLQNLFDRRDTMKHTSFLSAKSDLESPLLRYSGAQAAGGRRPAPAGRSSGTKSGGNRRQSRKAPGLFYSGLGIDMPFLIMVLVLLVIGILMMFSASYPVAYAEEDGDSYYYLKRQLLFAVTGVALMIFTSFINYHTYYRFAKILLAISFIGLILVLLMPSSTGIRRWIYLGSTPFQVSELSKFCVIVFMAYIATKNADKMKYIKYSFLPGAAVFVGTAALLLAEPHYSCIVIMFFLVLIMLYLGGMPGKYFLVIFGGAAVAFLIAWSTGILGYAMTRMDGWGQALIYTTDEMWQTTWQTRNSLYAIGSGGLTGLGLGNSRQKYLYLPEPQNDFVFAIVCEELGFIGAVAILALFALLVWRGIYVSQRAGTTFGKLLGCGISAQLGLQVILNILVITDWLPNTGISLPFFSYGGTSLWMMLIQMGVVLAVSRTSKMEKI